MKYELASTSWDEKEIEAIQRVIKKNNYTMGEDVKQFEADFEKFTGNKYCVMVNSGSSANLLAIAAMFLKKENPLKRGDEVIVPAVSWATTYYPLYQYGLKLKFVDVDKYTLNFDLNELKKADTLWNLTNRKVMLTRRKTTLSIPKPSKRGKEFIIWM